MSDHFLGQFQELRQTTILSPQLRQSLEILQAPTLELRTLVRKEMEQNPALEEQAMEMERIEIEPEKPEKNAEEEAFDAEFDKLAKLDDEWRDYFNQTGTPRSSKEDEERRQHLFDSLTQSQSLQQHLMNQLLLATQDAVLRQACELIIGSLNDDGFLTTPLDELASSSGIEPEVMERALALVQEFDPIGVAARDLRECLLIQLHRLGLGDSIAAKVVAQHLDLLGEKRLPEIARRFKVHTDCITEAARLIATLEPRPARAFVSEETAYVTPDITVYRDKDDYLVLSNNEQVPRLHISAHYRRLMEDEKTSSEVKAYIKQKVQSGMFLIRSIGQRQQTIRNIAREIVRVQRDFLEHGVTHLRPLTMAEIAGIIGVHETTVGRAIAGKYMQTPQGTFEMKYFFNPGYKTSDGQSVSNKSVKDLIEKLVAAEDTAHPLSDDELTTRLGAQGVTIARRTVAKYREELRILPSFQRRQHRETRSAPRKKKAVAAEVSSPVPEVGTPSTG